MTPTAEPPAAGRPHDAHQAGGPPAETRPSREAAAATDRTAVATGGRALLVYATRHGSTKDVAEAIAEQLRSAFAEVDVRAADEAPSPAGYDAVVLGGPMIMGWHRKAKRYARRHCGALAELPTALFITAASLTDTGEDECRGVPIIKDPWLVKSPGTPGKLSRKERYARPEHYLGGILDVCSPLRPRSVAFFGGSLDLTTMNLFEKLFVLLVIGATPGDGRNWEQIRVWSAGLGDVLTG